MNRQSITADSRGNSCGRRLLDRGRGRLPVELIKDWYSPGEVAELLGRCAYTIRQWCRMARIEARHRLVGRGGKLEWEISAEELLRFSNHGLRPQVRGSPDNLNA